MKLNSVSLMCQECTAERCGRLQTYPCCPKAAFLVHALAEAFQELCIVLQGRMLRVLKVETLHSPAHVRRPLLNTRAPILSQLPLQERPVALGSLYKSANRSTAQWQNSHHAH